MHRNLIAVDPEAQILKTMYNARSSRYPLLDCCQKITNNLNYFDDSSSIAC